MISNQSSSSTQENPITRLVTDNNLPFTEYIARTRAIIEDRRPKEGNQIAIDANSPKEFYPSSPLLNSNGKLKYGALLIHGLLDCPFTMIDTGTQLQNQGILARSILLPGHGTVPSDLMKVSYQDWIQAVRYGVESLRKDVEQIYLVGYSTGSALSIYHALHDTKIAGMILFAPTIKVKSLVTLMSKWHYQYNRLVHKKDGWILHCDEIDYTKYHSIAMNSLTQVNALTQVLTELGRTRNLSCPIYMIASEQDETISAQQAIRFFNNTPDPVSRMLLYSDRTPTYPDRRIMIRSSVYPELNITHFSHITLPFSPNNMHYGIKGDYQFASHPENDHIYGAYNRIEILTNHFLRRLSLMQKQRRVLTYNPDFEFMQNSIVEFIKR